MKVVAVTDREDGVVEASYCDYANLVGNTVGPQSDTNFRRVVGFGQCERPAWRIDYMQGARQSVVSPRHQTGLSGTPLTNVFGDWTVLSLGAAVTEPGHDYEATDLQFGTGFIAMGDLS